MSENSKNQSKNGNNENHNDKIDKKTDKDDHLRRLDENLDKLDEDSPLADYNAARQKDKDKLEQYTNFDNLSEEKKEKLREEAIERIENYGGHGENNCLQQEYNKKFEKVFKFSRFLESILNNIYLHENPNFEYSNFSGEKCRAINDLTEKQLYREKITANMKDDIYEISKIKGLLICITLED